MITSIFFLITGINVTSQMTSNKTRTNFTPGNTTSVQNSTINANNLTVSTKINHGTMYS